MKFDTPSTLAPNPGELRPTREENVQASPPHSQSWWWVVIAVLLSGAGYWFYHHTETKPPPLAESASRTKPQKVPVVAVPVRQGDLPVFLTGLGTVTPFNTVTVRSRVDGQLMKIAFQEGQFVRQGDLLVEIDARPFEVQLHQAEGQMARDLAQLNNTKRDLVRYQELVARQLIAKQQVDTQAAAVSQFEGALKIDQAAIDSAKLQLTYCRITAPISGRVGLRLVDIGNIVHANDQTGLVIITQVQPIAVLFTLPEDNLQPVLQKLRAGETLQVNAYDRSGQTQIATGSLLTTDNQIDPTTGTTRLKAVFQNQDLRLFPNQFVNVRMLLDVQKKAIIAPVTAIQQGPQGPFAYVVKADKTIEIRQIGVGPITDGQVGIRNGLADGELIVTDGVDKLRAGSVVEVHAPDQQGASQKPNA